jgi:hypothetical protein
MVGEGGKNSKLTHFPSFLSGLLHIYRNQLDLSQIKPKTTLRRKIMNLGTGNEKGASFQPRLSYRSDDDTRRARQNAFTCGWLELLPRILSHSKGDSKCRLTAAQLLATSSLLTSAFAVVDKTSHSPSSGYISSTRSVMTCP